MPPAANRLSFGHFEILPAEGSLTAGGTPVPVEPQVLDLIVFLAERAGQVVSRDDLIAGVWDGRIVSDSAISTRINAARKALDDDGTAQAMIRTIARRGYMFMPEVARQTQPPTGAAAIFSNKPAIAVLPFRNLASPDEQYFSDGMTDDIITELARYSELVVIARHSTFSYRDTDAPLSAIAADLGVRYIVEGSVRRMGNRVRVTAQLIDVAQNEHVWAERYDRDLADIFAVQDEITAVIVNTVVGKIGHLAYGPEARRAPTATDAYDHALRAMELFWVIRREENLLARDYALKALAIDPGFARAHAIHAWTWNADGSNRYSPDNMAAYRNALRAASQAIALDDREPWAHAAFGFAVINAERDHEQGLAAYAHAVDLNPSSAHFRSWHALGLSHAGKYEEGLDEIRRAMHLNPHYPVLYLNFLGRNLMGLRRFEEALGPLSRMSMAMPENSNGNALTAACYVALGRIDEARQAMRMALASSHNFTLTNVRQTSPFAREEDTEFYLDAFRKAGMPE